MMMTPASGPPGSTQSVSAQSTSAQPGLNYSGAASAPAADSSPVVAFRDVSIAFDGPPVLQDITFSIAPGETRILLGPATSYPSTF